ncbi:multicopper oxidase domain-containing protein [Arthrobacter sp. 08Y14]|uniref:multicopper oxidase domain-containing protein n=1 Tax=Arthrobacter sp. 08Y14 TaxID=2058885 RepID=UPI000CE3F633|nr:multicopper oxidase domain-containing protein [Arthrobacter sp. 08Y14]
MLTTRTYNVVAMSLPIVYTKDGDHDPNGMLFTLQKYKPLLQFFSEQWEKDDNLLPRLHRRRQLIQLVVDGLDRFSRMRTRLAGGNAGDRDLLAELGGDTEEAGGEDDETRGEDLDPRRRAVRQNYLATVEELRLALKELTRGQITTLVADPLKLREWRLSWQQALKSVDAAIAVRLAAVDNAFDLMAASLPAGNLPPRRVRQLMLNDHRSAQATDEHAPPYDRFNPLKPIPLVRPLVLRACAGETLQVRLKNEIKGRRVGLHLQGEGLGGVDSDGAYDSGVRFGDGAHVGGNPDSTVPFGEDPRTYYWRADHEGVWPINDLGDVRGTEQGTNVHGLFGALVVEPPGYTWKDPETGDTVDDGMYVDVIPPNEHPHKGNGKLDPKHQEFVDFHLDNVPRSFREFTVFLHDEPEIHSGYHLTGEHTVMPLSYRAEPMPNRLPHKMRRYAEATSLEPDPGQEGIDFAAVKIELDEELNEVFWIARDADGTFLERVAGEEQHHSSWLFGEPVTPILRAYRGDPARIRLVHAGVKETHVFHLHVHQWRAVPADTAPPSVWKNGRHRGSQLLDSITIGPQTAQTIDPLYGSGSRQKAIGDVIWHCHLYPHFHHGMWGLWRSFDRLVDGHRAYPDGTPCPALKPLPGRIPPPSTNKQPGFPWFMDAVFPQKSPPPPALRRQDLGGRRQLLRMPMHSAKEFAAFDPGCIAHPRPGALFVDLDTRARKWNNTAELPEQRILTYDVEVRSSNAEYNSDGWHDRRAHHYRITGVQVATLAADGTVVDKARLKPPEQTPPFRPEPFFPRANHGDIVELNFYNELGSFPADDFDLATLPVECGLHVHLVKFDVLAADGSATGWNYLSGASSREAVGTNEPGFPPRNVGRHRWVVDEEFGPCFFHDHLLANYRQKHGLFAALIAEPQRSRWYLPDQTTAAWTGQQAVIRPPEDSELPPYREACLAIGDFIPLYRADGAPLNRPHELGGDDDPGAMGVNYRNAPLRFRGDAPSEWFSSSRGANEEAVAAVAGIDEEEIAVEPEPVPAPGRPARDRGDPDTEIINSYPGERLRLRLIQGSHEEQHSFTLHGLRWRKEWHNSASPLVNQQTVGISEAFTLDINPAADSSYGIGDHLWAFAAMDDLWLGCWGLVRALAPSEQNLAVLHPLPRAGLSHLQVQEGIKATRPTPPRPTLVKGKWVDAHNNPVAVREYTVAARRTEHLYSGHALTDPWGLIYAHADGWRRELDEEGKPTDNRRGVNVDASGQPLVLRAHPGEWIRLTLVNEVLLEGDDPDREGLLQLPDFGPEISPPRLPIEHVDELGYPDERVVSPRVSLHPGLLRFDVVSDDGSYVGHNHDSTVSALNIDEDHDSHREGGQVEERKDHTADHAQVNWREYWWYADKALAPDNHSKGPGQVCYLHDMGDIRNHRHHGLVGALVVEPADCAPEGNWWGPAANIVDRDGNPVAREMVIFFQDGLRHFIAGDPDLPVRDIVPGDDPEDAGQKGINYRAALVNTSERLAVENPPTPTFTAAPGDDLWVRLVCAADKPRNHTFTLHGLAWRFAPWVSKGPWTDSLSGLTAGTTSDLTVHAADPGDHAYRSGVFRWAVTQGMWGLIRVQPAESGNTADNRVSGHQPGQ